MALGPLLTHKSRKKFVRKIHSLEIDKFLSFFARTNFQHVIVTYSSTRLDISDNESAMIYGLKQASQVLLILVLLMDVLRAIANIKQF